MTDPTQARTLLAELDAQQDDVIRQLDELDARISSVLKQHQLDLQVAGPVDPEALA